MAPHCAPFGPVGSLRTPFGVHRTRKALTVLYSQLSIAQNSPACWCSMLPARPKFVVNSSFLSATPSLFVSVYFHTSSALVSIVKMLFGPNGVTKRGNTILSTKARWCSYTPSLSRSSCTETRPMGGVRSMPSGVWS